MMRSRQPDEVAAEVGGVGGLVGADSAVHLVLPVARRRAEAELVVSEPPAVSAPRPADLVVPVPSRQRVVAIGPGQEVVARVAADHVIRAKAPQGVIPRPATEDVLTGRPHRHVITGTADHERVGYWKRVRPDRELIIASGEVDGHLVAEPVAMDVGRAEPRVLRTAPGPNVETGGVKTSAAAYPGLEHLPLEALAGRDQLQEEVVAERAVEVRDDQPLLLGGLEPHGGAGGRRQREGEGQRQDGRERERRCPGQAVGRAPRRHRPTVGQLRRLRQRPFA